MGMNDLLNNGQAQTGASGLSGEVRLEDFRSPLCGHSWAIVADIEKGLVGVPPFSNDLYFPLSTYGLDRV